MRYLLKGRTWTFVLIVFILPQTIWGQTIKSVTQSRPFVAEHDERLLRITRLEVLNSNFPERNLSLTANGSLMFFQSQRGGHVWSSSYRNTNGDSTHDGDIWVSERIGGDWQPPEVLPYGLNTSSNEDEPFALKKGKIIYFQSWNFLWEATNGPYYRKKRKRKKWKRSNGLGGGITNFFKDFVRTDGMTLSPDEKTFIVVAGEPNQLQMDVYWSRKGTFGWNEPERLSISTEGEERSVFLASDGRTLYFSSNGYGGYGGLDIFKTTLNEDGTFGQLINLGKPINTEEDDYGFIISADGNEGYFIRDGDIYMIDLRGASSVIKPSEE